MFPVYGVTAKTPLNFSQDICNFTPQGREKIHNNLKTANITIVRYLMNNPVGGQNMEYNDNRISLYVGQNGLCAVTKRPLEIGEMECHHKTPKEKGGNDEYKNLIFVLKDVHKLIHATTVEVINKYLGRLQLDENGLRNLNNLRLKVGNNIIQ